MRYVFGCYVVGTMWCVLCDVLCGVMLHVVHAKVCKRAPNAGLGTLVLSESKTFIKTGLQLLATCR